MCKVFKWCKPSETVITRRNSFCRLKKKKKPVTFANQSTFKVNKQLIEGQFGL